MSTTFFAPEAPARTVEVPCDFPNCLPDNRCGYCQDGIEHVRVTDLPEVNMAEGNAADILKLLGLPNDDCGVWEVPEMADIRQRILRVRATGETSQLNREASDSQGTRVVRNEDGLPEIQKTCRAVDFGNTDAQTLRRLGALEELLVAAQKAQLRVCWG